MPAEHLSARLCLPVFELLGPVLAMCPIQHQWFTDFESPRASLREAKPKVPVLNPEDLQVGRVPYAKPFPSTHAEHGHAWNGVHSYQVVERELIRGLPDPAFEAEQLDRWIRNIGARELKQYHCLL